MVSGREGVAMGSHSLGSVPFYTCEEHGGSLSACEAIHEARFNAIMAAEARELGAMRLAAAHELAAQFGNDVSEWMV